MDGWRPATKDEIQAALREIENRVCPTKWALYSSYLVEPYPAPVERLGQIGQVYVVAKVAKRVVYFEDIEDNFCTATEVDGCLTECSDYVDFRVAIDESLRAAGFKTISES